MVSESLPVRKIGVKIVVAELPGDGVRVTQRPAVGLVSALVAGLVIWGGLFLLLHWRSLDSDYIWVITFEAFLLFGVGLFMYAGLKHTVLEIYSGHLVCLEKRPLCRRQERRCRWEEVKSMCVDDSDDMMNPDVQLNLRNGASIAVSNRLFVAGMAYMKKRNILPEHLELRLRSLYPSTGVPREEPPKVS